MYRSTTRAAATSPDLLRRSRGRNVAGQQRHSEHNNHDVEKRRRTIRLDGVEQSGHELRQRDRGNETAGRADAGQPYRLLHAGSVDLPAEAEKDAGLYPQFFTRNRSVLNLITHLKNYGRENAAESSRHYSEPWRFRAILPPTRTAPTRAYRGPELRRATGSIRPCRSSSNHADCER